MKNHIHRIVALLLSLSMVFSLSACFGTNKETSGEDGAPNSNNTNTPGAMGRYVETEEALPEGIMSVKSMSQMPDGSLRMLGDAGGQGIGPWAAMSSKDGGRTWEPIDYPWLADLFGSPIISAALTPDGIYMTHTASVLDATGEVAEGENAGAEQTAAETDSADTSADSSYFSREYTFAYGDANGLTEIPFEPIPEHDTVTTTTLFAASNGDLLAVSMTGEVLQIDTKNWREKNTYQATPSVGRMAGVATYDNILAINSSDKITLYDLDSGSSKGDIPITTGITQASYMTQKTAVVSVPPDGSAYFYSNDSGLYRVPMDTAVSERLVDGGMSSMSIQTLNFQNIFQVDDDEYLALASTQEQGTKVFRYAYNPDIPTEPSQVLKVYSLYDNKTIRQAIAGYQLKNPDVRVSYQVGIDGGGGVTASDAMRSLSTELLAGKGPDVMVLDDMPVDSYIQKNVLYDLSELLTGDSYLANIVKAYEKDGKTYAIPARFSIPILLGNDIQNVKNLNDFVSWLETQYTYDIGIKAEDIVSRFYAACSNRWFTDDGALNEEAFRNDLEQLGTLAAKIGEVGEVQSSDNIVIDTLLWYGGAISANYGMLSGYVDVTLFEAAIKGSAGGGYHPFPNDGGDIFIPRTVLGINASSPETENARSFVLYTLSSEVQATDLGDGFPVNTAAFDQLSINQGGVENPESLVAAITIEDARTGELIQVELSSAWPSDEFMTAFKETLKNALVPVKTNAVIREMVLDETAGYISGTKSLDDTVRSFKEKMDIYLAE